MPRTETEPEQTGRPANAHPATDQSSGSAPVRFSDLGLAPDILKALAAIDFLTPTDIQRELIPIALTGRDCLGQARTGTGKTAAFALPMLQRLTPGVGSQGLVLVPTRELAAQVGEHFKMLGKSRPLRTVLVYGGRRIKQQIDQLRRNPEIIIGTPGRILDLMRRGPLRVAGVSFVVLDEIDRMLDIGFRDDIRRILRAVEAPHQTLFVSATIDEEIRKLARTFLHDPAEVNVSQDALTVEGIEHGFVNVAAEDKFQTLLGFLKHGSPTLAIVFTNTKHAARRVAERLKKQGVNCKEIHGDLMQSRRERVMESFRKSHIQVLVATDLASRGLDVMEVSHIVNYDIPEDSSVYVHRIGRTARMGRSGYAVTFVTPEQGKELTEIEKLLNQELPRFDEPWVVRPTIVPSTAPNPAEAPPEPASSSRLHDALRHDEVLESVGLRPLQRTLGSRFRAARRRRR